MSPAMTTDGAVAETGPASIWDGRREARLRAEHAQHYPGLQPGQWESAATLADRVLAGLLLHGRDLGLRGRLLRGEHFEFRGGGARGAASGGRPRREDR